MERWQGSNNPLGITISTYIGTQVVPLFGGTSKAEERREMSCFLSLWMAIMMNPNCDRRAEQLLTLSSKVFQVIRWESTWEYTIIHYAQYRQMRLISFILTDTGLSYPFVLRNEINGRTNWYVKQIEKRSSKWNEWVSNYLKFFLARLCRVLVRYTNDKWTGNGWKNP